VPNRGPLLLTVLSAVFFALMAVSAKVAAARLPGSEVAFVRFILMLVPFAVLPGLARQAMRFERLDLLLYRGLFGGTAVLLYFLAIAHIPVGIATLLNYTAPVFSVPFAAIFLGERVNRGLLVPLVAALLGMALAAGGGQGAGSFHVGAWELVGAASAVLSGAAVTAIRAARRTEGSWSIYASFSLFGLLATAPFALPGFVVPTLHEGVFLAAVGLFSVAAQLLMTYAYRWVTNLQAGVIFELTVVLSMLLGALFLGDRPRPIQIFGSILTIAGVVGVVRLQSTPRAVG
jgi:drug/metabolite transporter (DMT)-like permease